MDIQHYQLLIIGSGSGNSLIDPRFDGTSIALVDDAGRFGGTCLNVGCIPTKMFVLPADHAISPNEAARLGVTQQTTGVDVIGIRDRIFGRIDAISQGGLDWRERQPHVDVYRETASFVDDHTVELMPSGRRLSAERIVLAAGSRPFWPDLEIEPTIRQQVHTSDTVMRLPAQPRRVVILGGGFIAAEFGHVFSALGSAVTIVHRGQQLLRHEDRDVSARFTQIAADHCTLVLGEQVTALRRGEDPTVAVHTRAVDGTERVHHADVVLNATGRVPNSDRLGLENTGVRVSPAGFIEVDEHQRTSVEHIFALGDVCSPWMLKHVANHEMRVVQHNLLHPDNLVSSDHRFVPHAVFAHPQIGSVGLTEQEAEAQERPYLVTVQEYGAVAYGWAMEDTRHFAKLIADPLTGKLLGAHIIGPQAATLVQQLIQMMSFEHTIESVARGQYWIHPALPELVENALLGLVEQRAEWLAQHAE